MQTDTTTTATNRLGDVRVNHTDYDGRIVIEQCGYWGSDDKPSWAVPAWDECGTDLGGDVPDTIDVNGKPFVIGHFWSSVEKAEAALSDFLGVFVRTA